jgi:kumamolisin
LPLQREYGLGSGSFVLRKVMSLFSPRRFKIASVVISCALVVPFVLAPSLSASSLAAGFSGVGTTSSGSKWRALTGSTVPWVRSAKRLTPLSASRTLGITVSLKVRNQAALSDFLSAVYDPTSPQYHHFLTPQQFGAEFGPTAAQRAQVTSWLRSQGMQVIGTTANGMQIRARGTVSVVQKAMKTSLYTFRSDDKSLFANDSAVQLPSDIAPDVLAVSGLSSAVPAQPASLPRVTSKAQENDEGYTPSDIAGIYDYSSLLASGITGKGVTVAIATFAGFTSSDIATSQAVWTHQQREQGRGRRRCADWRAQRTGRDGIGHRDSAGRSARREHCGLRDTE